MINLTTPSSELYESWAAAVTEFGGGHIDGSGLADGVEPTREACHELIGKAQLHADRSSALPSDLVHCTYWWITDDHRDVVGFIALRHDLNDFLRAVGGHIGYAVRPSRRRQGIATAALRLVLDRARRLGLDRVLITCDDDNQASARTIERCGGVLQDVQDRAEHGYGLVRRYWIAL